jgi:hypothetical protein
MRELEDMPYGEPIAAVADPDSNPIALCQQRWATDSSQDTPAISIAAIPNGWRCRHTEETPRNTKPCHSAVSRH